MKFVRLSNRKRRIAASIIALVALAYQLPIAANVNRAPRSKELVISNFELLPNFDARQLHSRRASSDVERKRRTVVAQAASPDKIILRWNDELDLPHHLFSADAPLTRESNDDAEAIAKRFVRDNFALFEINQSELDASRVAARSVDKSSGFTRLALEQRVGGVRVADSEMLFILDERGRIVSESGSFIPGLARRSPDSTPHLTPEQALRSAVGSCGAELRAPIQSREDHLPTRDRFLFSSDEIDDRTEASLVYYPITRDDVRLAYQVMLYGAPTALDAYLVVVDARTGELLRRDSLTYALDAPAGRVFTKENPTVSVDREIVSFAGDQTASPQGWVADNRTRGNNGEVFINTDLSGGRNARANADGNFDFPLDLTPGRSPIDSADASATNLFYWVNVAHDRFHSLGFNEQSRNFQTNNFNRGGRGGDAVRADTLRGAAINPADTNQLVRNNAYFQISLEGTPPLLAMLMWTANVNGQTIELDSSYDAGVIIHEYTHGVSTRLSGTDNAVGLRSLQGSGMGEGWSDFFAMSFLNNGEPLDRAVATGSYVTQQARGVRAFPYSTSFATDPLTFGDIQYNTEVHAQGTVWCTILWDMRQAFVERYGFDAGRETAERLVLNGLKTLPISPTFVDARDAILLADRLTNNGANQDLIWRAFARRGLGRSASTSLTPPSEGFRLAATEGYDVPPEVTAGSLVINDKPPVAAVISETLPVVVADRDLMNAASVDVTVKNLASGNTATFTLAASEPGRFASVLRVLPPGVDAGPGPAIIAQPGDELVISYANARNESGAAETLEAHVTAGRRVTVYEYDFERGERGWTLFSAWHLTERRAASATHSLYFAKQKGENERKSFTKAGSSGASLSPQIDFNGLIKPQLEFDYFFSGALTGDGANPAGDLLTVGARNYPFTTSSAPASGAPVLGISFDARPQSDSLFHHAAVDLRFIGTERGFLSFSFAASRADINRKKLEGFYLDNVRVTAVSMR
ncbi:MAG TPA: M36 family metallopeptidase [Blastocatellia bacterium]|nr:M36 family metallopeptidase [Blastocatellia bacterium]